jgi:pilus assembly protein CpaE
MALPQSVHPRAAAEFLAVVGDHVTREGVRQAAAQLGWPQAAVRDGGLTSARALLEGQPAPAVLLVDVSDAEDVFADLDRLAEVCDAHTRVVAIGTVNDVGLYRALMEMGVSDYLVKPAPAAALTAALRRARDADRPEAPQPKSGRVIALIGARGGVGATSVATSAAWGLAHEQKRRTVLLDLDLQFGAAALAFDVEPGRGLRELLSNPERIDAMLIGSAIVQAGERLRVLAADEPLDAALELGAEGVPALLDTLLEGSEAAVVDVPRRLDAGGRAALARADVVGVVTDLSLAGLRDAVRLSQLLRSQREDREVLLIGNRLSGVPGELDRAEFERNLGRRLDFAVPFDAKAAAAAAGEGKPLLAAGGGPAASELQRLVRRLAGATGETAAPKAGWMQRLLGGR